MPANPTAVKSKTNIALALRSLMMEKPYRDISVSEIAKRSGLSRQAFYLNFKDKDDVLIHQFERLLCKILESIREKKIETLEQLVGAYTAVVTENSEEFRVLAENNLGGFLGDFLVSRFSDMPPVLPQQRPASTLAEHRFLNSFWIPAFISVYKLWLESGMETPVEDISRILVDIMKGSYFE